MVEAQETVDLERNRLQVTSKEGRRNMVRTPTTLAPESITRNEYKHWESRLTAPNPRGHSGYHHMVIMQNDVN